MLRLISFGYSAQRRLLPYPYLRQRLVRDRRFHSLADLEFADILHLFRYLSHCHPLCVYHYDLLLDHHDIPLVLWHDLWLESTVSILRHLYWYLSQVRSQHLGLISISAVCIFRVRFFSRFHLFFQLCLQHTLDRTTLQFLQFLTTFFFTNSLLVSEEAY